MNLNDCYNFEDFRKLAKKNLPAPIFHYIDGGSDDETTLKRNTESFLKCDLVLENPISQQLFLVRKLICLYF
jgi:L-lactate dehydrogenase (cytochrome)